MNPKVLTKNTDLELDQKVINMKSKIMKIDKFSVRLGKLSDEMQKLADEHSQPPHFEICGAPEMYFECSIPLDANYNFSENKEEFISKLGLEFMDQLRILIDKNDN